MFSRCRRALSANSGESGVAYVCTVYDNDTALEGSVILPSSKNFIHVIDYYVVHSFISAVRVLRALVRIVSLPSPLSSVML